MIYLASPYSDPDPWVRQGRYDTVVDFITNMMEEDKHLKYFSPILHWHPVAVERGLPVDAQYWWGWNKDILRNCDSLHVLTLPGWDKSMGVAMEIAYMEGLHKHVRFIDLTGATVDRYLSRDETTVQ